MQTPTRGGTIVSAGIIGGELILGLSDGSIVNAGFVQGAKGSPGPPGPPGPRGADGADGATILNGEGPPRPEVGKDGDFYIQVDATDLWGPKVGGRWLGPIHLLSEAARRDRIRGPGRPRGGPAFFGGTGPTTAAQAQVSQGLSPILVNNTAVPASTAVLVAEDDRGTLFECELRAEAANGVWIGSVRVGRFGNTVDHVVFGDFTLGTAPPNLTFIPSVAGGKLQLSMSSDVPLTNVVGVEVILTA